MVNRVQAARNLANRARRDKPNWPVPVSYLNGGAWGRVFVTNNGRLMKIQKFNLTKEFNVMKRLGSTGVAPRVRNGNIFKVKLGPTNQNLIKAMGYIPKGVNSFNMMVMNRVGNMTLRQYYKNFHPTKGYDAYIHSYIEWLMHKINKMGIEHRNLHRGNIMVSVNSDGRITRMWIIDFGKSKQPGSVARNMASYMKTYRLPYSFTAPKSPLRKTKSSSPRKSPRSRSPKNM
jgi:predicted Ser/Thr protein kinase